MRIESLLDRAHHFELRVIERDVHERALHQADAVLTAQRASE